MKLHVSRSHLCLRCAAALLPAVLSAALLLMPAHQETAAADIAHQVAVSADSVPPPPADIDIVVPSGSDAPSSNTAVLPVTVTVIPAPNIAPVILCATWDDVSAGTYTITCAIANDAPGTAEPSTAELSIDGTPVMSEQVPELGPGDSHAFIYGPVTLSDDADELALLADVHEEVRWDTRGNNSTELVVAPPDEETLNLCLEPGWNLISVPLLLGNDSRASIFPGVAVYTWDPSGRCYFEPDFIEPTRAYWVAVTEPITLPIHGLAVTSYVVDLTPGWHMLGSVWGDAADLCEPQGIPRGVVQLPAYSSMSGGTDYEVSITTETGTGFWLAATNECLLQVS